MNRRSFFSLLAGVALVPALARFARPAPDLRAMIVSRRRAALAEMSARWDAAFWPPPGSVTLTDKLSDGLGAQLCGLGPLDLNARRLPWRHYTATYNPPDSPS